MSDKISVIVLLSGGMDSTTALYHADNAYELIGAVSFDYGSKHNIKELPFAEYHCKKLNVPHQIIKLDFMDKLFESHLLLSGSDIPDGHYEEKNMLQTVVPFRNGIMLSIAAGYAESMKTEGLVIAAHSGDHAIYPDCREEFMEAMGTAISRGTYAQVELIRPFIYLNKSKITQTGIKLGIDYAKTWSCYKGEEIHCGSCGTCVERREAFIESKLPDPTAYRRTEPLPPKPE